MKKDNNNKSYYGLLSAYYVPDAFLYIIFNSQNNLVREVLLLLFQRQEV